MEKMIWRAGNGEHIYSEKGHYSARLPDGSQIEVHPDAYNKAFKSYVFGKGIMPTTWHEIMQKGEREWQAYCQIMDAFAENIQQWFNYYDTGIFIDLPFGQTLSAARAECDRLALSRNEQKRVAKRKMTWHAGSGRHCYSFWGYYLAYLEDGTRIEVPAEVYHRRFNIHLNDIGVQRTNWFRIMQKADTEWQVYCQLMNDFAEDIQQWLTFRGEGVFVTHPAFSSEPKITEMQLRREENI